MTSDRTVGSRLAVAAVSVLALAATPALAQRKPVLSQIDLPHAYYYREMYLPQLTTGPSGLAWSPDSQELVFSMAGSLWRQRLDSTAARQLTDGPGYDYQPDWSPDGRTVVYSSYRRDAIELWLLDLATGTTTQLTHGGAVNVEPRWSPDGSRIAYVSTAFNGHFHLFVAARGGAGFAAPVRLTGESRSALPRYYYGAFDHEISPSWTRDGQSLLYVSNRGHIHGTGGLWRARAEPGAPAIEVHYEETNWRMRPEFSPDGARIVYSSYLGRNWHQLWLMPANGGDVLPLTYGDWDATDARWSPDGRRIAFISNRTGNTQIELQDVPGGTPRPLETRTHTHLGPTATLELTIVDAAGVTVPARVSITDARGRAYAPDAAWMHADDGYDRRERPFEPHYFHTRGHERVTVPAGALEVEALRGLEAAPERRELTLAAGELKRVTLRLATERWPAPRGEQWVSGDVHVHMNYGGHYRNAPAHLAEQAEAEDLGVVHNLIVNKEQRVPDIDYSGRRLDVASRAGVLVVHGQEFHSSWWGHLGVLDLAGGMIVPGYVAYPNTAAASLVPTNADVVELARPRGALIGYVHPFDEDPRPGQAGAAPLTMELPVDVALGKVDYMEIVGFSDHRATAAVWYRLLNLGFRLPAAGGTDAMANYASLRGPVGMNRVYVRVPDGPLDPGRWEDALRHGRTFATNGPLLAFELGGRLPGDELALDAASDHVPFRAVLRSIVPVDHLEVVCDGELVQRLPLAGARRAAEVSGGLPIARSGWCVLRASTDEARYPVLDNYAYATTSPVYVTVAGQAPRSPADAQYFLAWLAETRAAAAQHSGWNSAAERDHVLGQLDAARAVYERLQ
jgi:TolB protein